MRNAVLLLLLLISADISAENWKVIGDEHYAPYSFISADGLQPQGTDVDLVKAVLDEARVKYTVRLYPWERLTYSLLKGTCTAAFPFADTPERRNKFLLVGPIRYGQTVFIVSKDIALKDWSSFADLAPYTIGQVRGFTYLDAYDRANLTRNTHANNPQQLVSMLLAGRIDVIVGDKTQLLHWVKQKNAQHQVRLLPTPLVVMPRYVAFAKGDHLHAKQFSDALERLHNSGLLEQFYVDQE